MTSKVGAVSMALVAERALSIGEEVTIDYLARFVGDAQSKRAALREQYRFVCVCARCASTGGEAASPRPDVMSHVHATCTCETVRVSPSYAGSMRLT